MKAMAALKKIVFSQGCGVAHVLLVGGRSSRWKFCCEPPAPTARMWPDATVRPSPRGMRTLFDPHPARTTCRWTHSGMDMAWRSRGKEKIPCPGENLLAWLAWPGARE